MIKIYLLSAIVAFAFSLVFCRVLIPILRKMKTGQNILVYVKEHKGKGGTPTMGGIAFVFATLLSVALFANVVGSKLVRHLFVVNVWDILNWRCLLRTHGSCAKVKSQHC